VVFMLRATVWTQRETMLGLLVLGTGFPAAFVFVGASMVSMTSCAQVYENGRLVRDTCSGVDWVAILAWTVVLGYLALQAFTIWRLSRSARR
jgi:hypothetical protein